MQVPTLVCRAVPAQAVPSSPPGRPLCPTPGPELRGPRGAPHVPATEGFHSSHIALRVNPYLILSFNNDGCGRTVKNVGKQATECLFELECFVRKKVPRARAERALPLVGLCPALGAPPLRGCLVPFSRLILCFFPHSMPLHRHRQGT